MATDYSLQERVRVEQQAMLFSQGFSSTLAGVPFAVLLAWGVGSNAGLSGLASTVPLLIWLALRLVIVAARMVLRIARLRSTDADAPVWSARFVCLLAIDGFIWGLIGTWLLPLQTGAVVTLVLTALIGVAAVGVFVLQTRFTASLVFMVMTLVPPALWQLARLDEYGIYAGCGLLIFTALMLNTSKGAEVRLRELLRLRFDTDRIALERAEALALAQRHSEVKSQFLATMSHEMRTPLHGILGVARLLHADLPAGAAEASHRLALIEQSGEHLLELISDLLDFSKIEAGQLVLAREPLDLPALLDRSCAAMADSAREKHLTLQVRAGGLGPAPVWVMGDASRLRQVLLNLIGNAIKFTERGGVTVLARRSGERVTIEVQDSGIGVAEADRERIFDAFHQVENSFDRRFTGTGLGLTISRELARAMQGDLVCGSGAGPGATFTLTLTLTPTAPPQGAPQARDDGNAALRGTVLLAEDNEVNALVARAVLERAGLTVEVVSDGEAALARCTESHPPDLVLMDCQMPLMDGFEATRRIRAFESAQGRARMPVVALTANAYEADRERCLAAGMDDHLSKPFRATELRAALRRHLAAPLPSVELTA